MPPVSMQGQSEKCLDADTISRIVRRCIQDRRLPNRASMEAILDDFIAQATLADLMRPLRFAA